MVTWSELMLPLASIDAVCVKVSAPIFSTNVRVVDPSGARELLTEPFTTPDVVVCENDPFSITFPLASVVLVMSAGSEMNALRSTYPENKNGVDPRPFASNTFA